ncbi:MAG: DUF2889 domain-containing protein [Pseudomonadota bacterium]
MALFERNKNIKVDIIKEGLLKAEAYLLDNVHHISTTFHISFPAREIIHAEANFQKAPYVEVCCQTSQKMANLVGLKIRRGFAEKVNERIGGECGCHHLVDITLEVARSMAQFIDNPQNLPLSDYIEDAGLIRNKIFEIYPKIKNMCFAYNIQNDHLFTKEVKCGLKADLML